MDCKVNRNQRVEIIHFSSSRARRAFEYKQQSVAHKQAPLYFDTRTWNAHEHGNAIMGWLGISRRLRVLPTRARRLSCFLWDDFPLTRISVRAIFLSRKRLFHICFSERTLLPLPLQLKMFAVSSPQTSDDIYQTFRRYDEPTGFIRSRDSKEVSQAFYWSRSWHLKFNFISTVGLF